jgi:cold shock CspA family protein
MAAQADPQRSTWNSPIPVHRGRAMKGRIVELSRGRFCGVIEATDGQRAFFHGRDLDSGRYNDIDVGTAVTFELIDDRISGARAARVRAQQAGSL